MNPKTTKPSVALAAAATALLLATVNGQTTLVDEDWQTDPLIGNGTSLSTQFSGWTYTDTGAKARNENNQGDVPGDTSVTDSHGYNQVVQLEGDNTALEYDITHNWASTDVYYMKVEASPMSWSGQSQRYIRPDLRQQDGTVLWSTAQDSTTAMPLYESYMGGLTDYPSELTFFFEIDASTFTSGTEGEPLRLRIDSSAQRGVYINDVTLVLGPLPADNTAPDPDPLTWDIVPTVSNFKDISMRIGSGRDPSEFYGVEYYFENTVRGTNSGWQDSREWAETDLDFNTLYTYRVKARDKSPNQNESTTWSSSESATTEPQDLTPPSPDPLTWETVPEVADYRSITMGVNAATDPSGVEYKFKNVTNGTDSGWIASRKWTQKDLDPDTSYTYEVIARDTSLALNESTTASSQESVTTPTEPANTLFITRFQDPLISDNTNNLDLGAWTIFRPDSVRIQQATGDGVRTDTDITATNQVVQFEWTDAEIQYNLDHTWSSTDIFTLTLNASPQSWSGESQRYVRPSLRQQDGTVLWAPGENMSGPEKTAVPLYSTLVGSSYQDDSNLTFSYNIPASAFSTGSEGQPIALRIDSSGARGLFVDNVHLSVTTGGGGGTDFATWISGFTLTDSTFDGDDDADGLGNGLEALFGTAPDVFNAGLAQFEKSGSTVTFTHPNPETPLTDVTGSYEWSLNLSNWNNSGDTVSGTTVNIAASPDDPAAGTTTVTCTIPDTVPNQFFVRAVATQN